MKFPRESNMGKELAPTVLWPLNLQLSGHESEQSDLEFLYNQRSTPGHNSTSS